MEQIDVRNEEAAPFSVGGVFEFELVRDGQVVDKWTDSNLVTNEGLNDLLQVHLVGGTQKTTWYVGLFEANYIPLATLTAALVANSGYADECVAYDETTRPTWVGAVPASQSTTNSASKATFTLNATKTIYGAFLISDNTKDGTAGKLFAITRFSTARSVVATDQLLVTYTVSASTSA